MVLYITYLFNYKGRKMKNVLVIVFIWIAGSIYFNSCNTKKETADTVEHTTESNSLKNTATDNMHASIAISEKNSTSTVDTPAISEKNSTIDTSTLVEHSKDSNLSLSSNTKNTVSTIPVSTVTKSKEVLHIDNNTTLSVDPKTHNSIETIQSTNSEKLEDNHTNIVISNSDNYIVIPQTATPKEVSKVAEKTILKNEKEILVVNPPLPDIVLDTNISQPDSNVIEDTSIVSSDMPENNDTNYTNEIDNKLATELNISKSTIKADINTSIVDTNITKSATINNHTLTIEEQPIEVAKVLKVPTTKVTSVETNISSSDDINTTKEPIPEVTSSKIVENNNTGMHTNRIQSILIPPVIQVPKVIKALDAIKITTKQKNDSNVLLLVYDENNNTSRVTKEMLDTTEGQQSDEKYITLKTEKEEALALTQKEQTEINTLNEKNSKLEATIRELQTKIESGNAEQTEEITKLKMLHETDVQRLAEEKAKKEETLALTQKEQTEINTLNEKNSKLEATIRELQTKIESGNAEQTEEITKLKMLHATDVQRLVEEKSKNQRINEEREQALIDNVAELSALKLVRNTLEKEKTKAVQLEQKSQDIINQLKQENTKLQTMITELKANIENETTQHAQEKEMQDKVIQEAKAKIKQITEEKEKLEALILTQKNQISKQEAIIAEKQSKEAAWIASQKKALEIETKRIETEKANIEELLTYIKEEKERLKTLQAKKIQTFTEQKAKYDKELQKKDQAIKNDLAKISALMLSYKEVEEKENKAIALKQNFSTQLEKEQTEKDALAAKVEALIEKNKKLTQEIQSLQAEDKNESARLAALKSALDKKSQEIDEEKSKLENLRNTETQNFKSEKLKYEEKCQEKDKELENNLAKLSALMLLKDKLETETTKAKQTAQENADALSNTNTKLQTVEKELQDATAQLTQEKSMYDEALQKSELEIKKITEEKRLLEEKIKAQASAQEKEQAVTAAKEKLFSIFALTHVKFKTNSPELTNESKTLLNTAANTMKKYPYFNYEIHGHTDSSGDKDKNLKLSIARAESVKTYLIDQGVDASILKAKGFGSAQPLTSNDTKEGRQRNRRVVFKIIKQ